MTKFVRANALYFKGKWLYPFEHYFTSESQFYLLDETIVRVDFLKGDLNINYQYGSFDGYSVLKLPYENGPNTSFSMYFLLPDKRNGLPSLLIALNFETLSQMELTGKNMDSVCIPMFKFSYEINARDSIRKMGLEMPYKGNQLDYAGMMQFPEKLPNLCSTVIQKSFIEIDEYGTEASAVSVVMASGCCAYKDPNPKFIADHPFMFMIKEDRSELILFTGTVLQPDTSTMQAKVHPPSPWEQRWSPLSSPYINQEWPMKFA